MTAGGWILLGVSWVTLSVLFFYCVRRALRDSEGENPSPDDPS
jgi:hypothetical protein